MDKNPLYKIISAISFLLIFSFTVILFSKTSKQFPELKIYYFIIIIVAAFFTLFNFWLIAKKTDFINFFTDEQKETTKEITKKIHTEFDEIKKRENLKNTIFDLLKGIEDIDNIEKLSEKLLQNFAEKFSIVQGVMFVKNNDDQMFHPISTYAYYSNEKIRPFRVGEGISGQVAKNKNMLSITNIPENYITILSGLGSSSPSKLLIIPFIANDNTIAVIELASFSDFPDEIQEITEEVSLPVGELIENINK